MTDDGVTIALFRATTEEQANANARLLAAGPEVLAALKRLVTGDGQALKSRLVDAAFAAIAKTQ